MSERNLGILDQSGGDISFNPDLEIQTAKAFENFSSLNFLFPTFRDAELL